MSVDIADAFSSLYRSVVISAVETSAPELLPVVLAWCSRASVHMISDPDSGEVRWVTQLVGLDE